MLIGHQNFHLLLRNIKIQSTAQRKITPLEASKKSSEQLVYSNFQNRRVKQIPIFK